jgi:hypothetical protein
MRELIASFDRQFSDLNSRSVVLIQTTGDESLYWHPNSNEPVSVGGSIVRSAAAVEQMVGGITTRLWDDPFEWTLPESLSRTEDVLDYLAEVETSRQRGFAFFKTDVELAKALPAPVEIKTLHEVLRETLARAEALYAQAMAIRQMLETAPIKRDSP